MVSVNADELVSQAASSLGITLELMVAKTAQWVDPDVYSFLFRARGSGVVFPDRRRARTKSGEKRGDTVGHEVLDDNSYANLALKQCLGMPRTELRGFHVCHIWEGTCYDTRYHTNVANLVLIPAAVAGLSDHHLPTIDLLRFRSYELYKWKPEGEAIPSKPATYPAVWPRPAKAGPSVWRWLAGQLGSGAGSTTQITPCELSQDEGKSTVRPKGSGIGGEHSQRSLMRRLYLEFEGDSDACIREYAAAESRGEVLRKRTLSGLTAKQYARAVWRDGITKGWLR